MNVLVGVDQLANAILRGWPDETISARCWRERERRPFKTLRPVIDGLFFGRTDHCRSSYEAERRRAQSPPEERAC